MWDWILSNFVKNRKNCEAIGVDPSPHGAGVKFWNGKDSKIHNSHIIQAGGESLPFPAEDFDVVFSSHVLEHVLDQVKVLQEMKRVLKKEGILIIGVPTHHMAWIQLISSVLFTTHLRLMKYFIGILDRSYSLRFVNVLIPPSHSYENKTVLYDLKYYRPKIWESLIKDEFKIKERIFPALYAYPDFIQLFKPRKLRGIGSSVYFICHK